MPHYTIRHITRFRYDAPVRENVTEARMQPRTDASQRCLRFALDVVPAAQTIAHQDYLGNIVHSLNIPATHVEMRLTADALVEVYPLPLLSEDASGGEWQTVDRLGGRAEFWDFVHPSRYTQPTPLLRQLMDEFDVSRAVDPFAVLRMLNRKIYQTFAYAPQSTRVDSPIDEAIAARQGVCQDLTHIMIALTRQVGIPCRYVSGYLFHRFEDHDRSAEDATHAWAEAFLPELGWIGLDPTNNLLTNERHIKVAVGRDYADVPPTRGVYVGDANETLSVGVRVALADAPRELDETILPDAPWTPPSLGAGGMEWQYQQQ